MATQRQIEDLVSAQLVAWYILLPYRNYPNVKPCVDSLEAWFSKLKPDWTKVLESEKVIVGAVPQTLAWPLQIPGWLASLFSPFVLAIGTAGLFAAGCALSDSCRETVKDTWDKLNKSRTSPPKGRPPNGPDGKPIPPAYVPVLQTAVAAAAGVLLGGYAIKKLAPKIPKIPPPPKWIWPVLVIGGLGVLAYLKKSR